MHTVVVTANWDEEAAVWVAESDDVPGLATEAETREELISKLRVMIPELLQANLSSAVDVPEYVMHWHQETRIKASA